MFRKQFLVTRSQALYLRRISQESGESEGHFVREAIEEHARFRGRKIQIKRSATAAT